MTISAIEVHELQEQSTAVIRQHITRDETERIPVWLGETYEAVARAGREPAGMPFVRVLSMDGEGMDLEVGWPVAEPFSGDGDVRASSLPGGPAAVASYFGPYDGVGPAYEAIQAWCTEQGHEVAGPPWESYFNDPQQEPDPAKLRTDIHFPIKG